MIAQGSGIAAADTIAEHARGEPVDHSNLDDQALVELAQRGSAPAFAVLMYRCIDDVEAALAPTSDRAAARRTTFLRAMRELDSASGEFTPWVTAIARDVAASSKTPARSDGDPRRVDETEPPTVGVEGAEIDHLWRDLAPRWPSGRRPIIIPTFAVWLATLVVTVALSAAVPWITLGQFDDADGIPALRAFPIDSPGSPAAVTPEPDDERDPLPTFVFPSPPDSDDDTTDDDDDGPGPAQE